MLNSTTCHSSTKETPKSHLLHPRYIASVDRFVTYILTQFIFIKDTYLFTFQIVDQKIDDEAFVIVEVFIIVINVFKIEFDHVHLKKQRYPLIVENHRKMFPRATV